MPDPTNPQQYNRYSYVNNSPINFNDPTGHCANEFDDAACWQEYDALFNQFLANNWFGDNIIDLIGKGEDYVRKDRRIIELFDAYRNCGGDLDCSDNSPRAWDPHENTCGWQYWEDCYDPLGDFTSIGGNTPWYVGVQIIWDEVGNVYININISPFPGLGAHEGNIKINDDGEWIDIEDLSVEQKEEAVKEFLTGWGSGGCASFVLSGCVAGNQAGDRAWLGGFATPGLAPSLGYTFLAYDKDSPQPWFLQRWFNKE